MRRTSLGTALALTAAGTLTLLPITSGHASDPADSSLSAPGSATWTGGPYTGAVPDPATCTDATCDSHSVALEVPADFWDSHEGSVTVDISWASSSDDFDLYVHDASGAQIASSAAGGTSSESVDLGELAPGEYTVQVVPWLTANAAYDGRVSLDAVEVVGEMKYPESRKAVEEELVQEYPLNVVFVGRTPSAEEVAELKKWIPERYKPTVATKSPSGGELTQTGAGLLNWNKDHLSGDPYFLGITYEYDVNVLVASDEYAKALFQTAEDATAQGHTYQAGLNSDRTRNQVKYDETFGTFRVLAKGGDPAYKVTDPTKTDLIDAYAVEDWIFDSRLDAAWDCAFTDAETGDCVDASVIAPDAGAYHDPYYDRDGLNLDHMPQGPNQGSSFFFLDTFTPDYADDYFRPNAYHTYGTDKVIDGQVVPGAVEDGGSWRITDPDTGSWAGVDYARTWGGRYRFHFVDLGAAPNDFEAASWAGKGLGMSNDYPHGDPPVWQYDADPIWQQPGEECATEGTQIAGMDLPYNDDTPCRMMPRLGRSVAYGLFFRSTAGYLYRPIPRGDVYWLAVSSWTDFYSRPQWVEGQLTNAPWYGTWWTDPDVLYKIGNVVDGVQQDDTLRWLSSATPYARWVGRKDEVIPLYDPTNNQPTGEVLDTSPKSEDLPAPAHHFHTDGGSGDSGMVPEPLHDGEHEHVHYGDSTVDLTEVSNAVEKAKAHGVFGFGYDGSVSHESMRDFIDANREGIADQVEGVNTIPSINMVFEKAYTWALPAIVGGIAVGTEDGEAWGVMNNVNDRFKWSKASYPGVQPGDEPGSKRSMTDASLPTQDSGGGFSYTIEHEAAHNLGLSHPHDGSYGVDRCPEGHAQAGEWECYWTGLGWMYDISAAPTTYAMDYRPYEVEDQDNLQRGHVAEYLIAAQDALRARLTEEAAAGSTEPSAGWSADFERMKEWRAQAGELFRAGDYLHAEYAARNASLAARGVPQTEENTTAPRLVEAGQVFYFTVNPQGSDVAEVPNLTVTDLVAEQGKKRVATLTATIANTGAGDAADVTVEFRDGETVIGTTEAVALAGGAKTEVSVTWDVAGIHGDRTVRATVDPADVVAESDEADNSLARTVTVRGNRVTNGSFETTGDGGPEGWSGSTGTSYDDSGAHATDGEAAVGLTGPGAAWVSAPVEVTPGETLQLALDADGTTLPLAKVRWLDSTGTLSSLVEVPLEAAGGGLAGELTVPGDATALRIRVVTPTTTPLTATTWVDDVWLW